MRFINATMRVLVFIILVELTFLTILTYNNCLNFSFGMKSSHPAVRLLVTGHMAALGRR